jgi:hypothetical protein
LSPQDVTVVADELYVPASGTAGVVVVQRGSGAIRTIDLSEIDPDGKPDCVSAIRVEDRVFVACGKLEEFIANAPGTIAAIDVLGDLVSFIEMQNKNPFGLFQKRPDNNEIVIPTVPDFVDYSTGCVERIDTDTSTALGCGVTTGSRLAARYRLRAGGWRDDSVDGGRPDVTSAVVTWGFDLTNDTLIGPLSPPADPRRPRGVPRSATIIVADGTLAANGLRVYSNDVETTTTPPRSAFAGARICSPATSGYRAVARNTPRRRPRHRSTATCCGSRSASSTRSRRRSSRAAGRRPAAPATADRRSSRR